MLLDGSSNLKDDIESSKKDLHLQKSNEHIFDDEWDWVIENYTVGANDYTTENPTALWFACEDEVLLLMMVRSYLTSVSV